MTSVVTSFCLQATAGRAFNTACTASPPLVRQRLKIDSAGDETSAQPRAAPMQGHSTPPAPSAQARRDPPKPRSKGRDVLDNPSHLPLTPYTSIDHVQQQADFASPSRTRRRYPLRSRPLDLTAASASIAAARTIAWLPARHLARSAARTRNALAAARRASPPPFV
ncbi:hypothetical protein ACSSS7_005484 [Eimeria intestinalis]